MRVSRYPISSPPMPSPRDHYFPNTGPLAANEMRVIALGTGSPLALAHDLMVFNVTPDDVRVRLAVTPTHVWPNKGRRDGFRAAPRNKPGPRMSRWLADKQLFPKFQPGTHDGIWSGT